MKNRRVVKMLVSDNLWYDESVPGDVEIDGECYETVVVEGWQPDEFYEPVEQWSEEGELLAEICVEESAEPQLQLHQQPQQLHPHVYVHQQFESSDSDDCTNLSWLMNFKLDDIINSRQKKTTSTPHEKRRDDTAAKRNDHQQQQQQQPEQQRQPSPGVAQTENKPPFTYTKLIELALRDKGELTVSGIYKWISERYPFFKPHDDRWKNSVRHNLSINPHFRKGPKAPRGAGHLWGVATPCNAFDYVLNSHKKVKVEPTLEQEVAAAAASILQQHPTEFMNPVSVEQVAVECGLLDPISFTY